MGGVIVNITPPITYFVKINGRTFVRLNDFE